jgi:hypothetical protein
LAIADACIATRSHAEPSPSDSWLGSTAATTIVFLYLPEITTPGMLEQDLCWQICCWNIDCHHSLIVLFAAMRFW